MRRTTSALAAVAMICLMMAGFREAAAAAAADDVTQANELYQRGNVLGALPLYERLAAADPGNPLYAERLAMGLVGSFEVLPAGPERDELIRRARAEAERSGALGNKSALLQTLLDRLNDPSVHNPSPEQLRLKEAEAAFGRGDHEAALQGYLAVLKDDPRSYLAHLYIGDIHYIRGDSAQAGEWFAKAIAIDPDREVAYRYWADALAKAGDQAGAMPLYIKAVVAEPYVRTSQMALQQWASRNGHRLQKPGMPVPKVTLEPGQSGKDAKMNISIDPSVMADPRVGGAWLAYATTRMTWLKEKFAERNPGMPYRHSLQEELEAFAAALHILEREARPLAEEPPTVRTLRQLGEDGMLAPYVLLNAADEGIAQDYPAFRAQNRELLVSYIEKHMIGRGAATQAEP